MGGPEEYIVNGQSGITENKRVGALESWSEIVLAAKLLGLAHVKTFYAPQMIVASTIAPEA